ncbi:hypothetical protein Hdeb2414_s0020g00566211 [Helianthus debilis subsp. tardiflorus]
MACEKTLEQIHFSLHFSSHLAPPLSLSTSSISCHSLIQLFPLQRPYLFPANPHIKKLSRYEDGSAMMVFGR